MNTWLVEIDSTEIDWCSLVFEASNESVYEILKIRLVIESHLFDRLVHVGDIGAGPASQTPPSVSAQLIRGPYGLDVLVLSEPLGRVGLLFFEREGLVERAIVHDRVYDAVRLLVQAGHNREVIRIRWGHEVVVDKVGVRADRFEIAERGQIVHFQVVPAETVKWNEQELRISAAPPRPWSHLAKIGEYNNDED